jgi:iron(III) transport system substrate-binding protein
MLRTSWIVVLAVLLVLPLSACQPAAEEEAGEVVIYSGRSEVLVDSLVEMYRQQTGVDVQVRYGSDAQLLAALEEEGDRSPADVFWANTTGALGQAVQAGLLAPLPDSLLRRPTGFVPSGGRWMPITTRFRVLAYNPDRVSPEELPTSVLDLPDRAAFAGRIGWTPTYSSFQDFVTALRVVHGEDTTRAWLEGMQALDPNAYASNTPMIQALAAGEIDVALTNHYYVLRLKYGDAKIEDPTAVTPEAAVATHHFAPGDIGNLALVTGAGVLQTSDQAEQAHDVLRFLLSEPAQSFAANTLNEYPLIEQAEVPDYLMPLDEARQLSPTFDLERLSELDATLQLLRDVGAL